MIDLVKSSKSKNRLVYQCSGEIGGSQFLGTTLRAVVGEGLNYIAALCNSQVIPRKTRETSWGSLMTPLDHQIGRCPPELARATQLKRDFLQYCRRRGISLETMM